MDADRFDALSRALSAPRSRRGALGALLGALLPFTPALGLLAARRGKQQRGTGGKTRNGKRQKAGTNDQRGDRGSGGYQKDRHLRQDYGGNQRRRGNSGVEACKAPGKPCTKAKERKCCSKKCSNGGKCLCTAAKHCPQPSNTCKLAVCSRGRCQITTKGDDAPCPGGTCQSGQCQPDPVDPTCTDGEKNGNESDVDCGGSCTDKCGNGKSCHGDGDCQSGRCCGGTCRDCCPGTHCWQAFCNGSILTKEGICQSNGTCPAAEQENCDDGIGCTDDACDPVNGCTHVANDSNCPINDQICDPEFGGCRCPDEAPDECQGQCMQIGEPCPTGLPGICDTGTYQCVSDTIECVPDVQPGSQPEICDGQDNDCDGQIDEDFDVGQPCTTPGGQPSIRVCDESGNGTICFSP
jgi:hypothetical protein